MSNLELLLLSQPWVTSSLWTGCLLEQSKRIACLSQIIAQCSVEIILLQSAWCAHSNEHDPRNCHQPVETTYGFIQLNRKTSFLCHAKRQQLSFFFLIIDERIYNDVFFFLFHFLKKESCVATRWTLEFYIIIWSLFLGPSIERSFFLGEGGAYAICSDKKKFFNKDRRGFYQEFFACRI